MFAIGFFLVIIVQWFSPYSVNAAYNKDVICIFDEGKKPICEIVPPSRRHNRPSRLPTYDPYVPRHFEVFYNCTDVECRQINLSSLAQVIDPSLVLRGCFKSGNVYKCELLRYHHMKQIDKLLFLNSHIKNKTFYTADCLIYEDGGRVCLRRDKTTYADLIDTGTIVRQNQTGIFLQDEFICEEGDVGNVNCFQQPYVSYNEMLMPKESLTTMGKAKVLLKSGNSVIPLQQNCLEAVGPRCAYSGILLNTARRQEHGRSGRLAFRCRTVKGQLVCERESGKLRSRPSLQGRLFGRLRGKRRKFRWG